MKRSKSLSASITASGADADCVVGKAHEVWKRSLGVAKVQPIALSQSIWAKRFGDPGRCRISAVTALLSAPSFRASLLSARQHHRQRHRRRLYRDTSLPRNGLSASHAPSGMKC